MQSTPSRFVLPPLTIRGCCWVSDWLLQQTLNGLQSRQFYFPLSLPVLPVSLYSSKKPVVYVRVCVFLLTGPKSQLTGTCLTPPFRTTPSQMSLSPWFRHPHPPPVSLPSRTQHVCPRGALLPAPDTVTYTWGFKQCWRYSS